jgi:hypothetical protein
LTICSKETLTVLFCCLLAQGWASAGPDPSSEAKAKADAQMSEILKKNEGRWRQAYSNELAKPVLAEMEPSRPLFPKEFDGLALGLSEDRLRELRPNLTEAGFGAQSVRQVYEYVPGSLNEEIVDAVWARVMYSIHRRRVVAVTFHSILFTNVKRANEVAEALVAKYLPLAGKPTEMKVANDVWGQPDRAALVFGKGNIFVVLMRGRTERKEHPLILIVGATAYRDDVLKYYSFADLPADQVEQVVRERFPFLQKMGSAGE